MNRYKEFMNEMKDYSPVWSKMMKEIINAGKLDNMISASKLDKILDDIDGGKWKKLSDTKNATKILTNLLRPYVAQNTDTDKIVNYILNDGSI